MLHDRIRHKRIDVQEFRHYFGIDDSKAYDMFSNIKSCVTALSR